MITRKELFRSVHSGGLGPAVLSGALLAGLAGLAPAQISDGPAPPPALLVDATEQSGITFVHDSGTSGEFHLPEITGSGGALLDFDNDGDLDLYIVQSGPLISEPENRGAAGGEKLPLGDRLYRNDWNDAGAPGQLPHFSDVTEQSGIRVSEYGMGVATGDFDNDGWVDLYVTNLGPNRLLRNNGDGTFEDVTERAGVAGREWSTSASFLDYDRDGRLDLFVTNYVEFAAESAPKCYSTTSARDYCGPDAHEPTADRLFHNRGDGSFEDVSERLGVAAARGAGLGVVSADFNGDGWVDIYVANDGDPNRLWINLGGKKFEDRALLAGVALNRDGLAEAGMGVDAADFDADGDEDVFLAHLAQESNTLYVNQGDGFFDDMTIRAGLHGPSLPYTGFGTRFWDYDNDGRLDLLVVNGAVRMGENLGAANQHHPLAQPNQLFWNSGKGSYEEVSRAGVPALGTLGSSRGAAFGDVDNDGDQDVVIFNNGGPTQLLLNQVGARRHWLGLRLLEKRGGRDSFHARVEVTQPDGAILWRRVHTDGSYCSASDPRVLIGLGESGGARTVRVHWPDGEVEQWKDLDVDRYWVLEKGAASGER